MKKVFLDTNVLIYFYTSTEPEKKRRAAELLLESEGTISTQVLGELANVLSKKYHFTWKEISAACDEVKGLFSVQTVSIDTISKAIVIAERYKYSYFDSLIISAALAAECSNLYSEDFQNSQIIEGLKIVNPFL